LLADWAALALAVFADARSRAAALPVHACVSAQVLGEAVSQPLGEVSADGPRAGQGAVRSSLAVVAVAAEPGAVAQAQALAQTAVRADRRHRVHPDAVPAGRR
jgi:hypothetical protein